jgi:hypothetical protein
VAVFPFLFRLGKAPDILIVFFNGLFEIGRPAGERWDFGAARQVPEAPPNPN